VGELFVIQRALHVQEAPCELSQMDYIFHVQCTIGRKLCKLIIDGGKCTNVASTTLIDKLQLSSRCFPLLILSKESINEAR